MMKRTNESGRSMVEMLGVLAIIGVLSVGGIAGYTMAMNRYRANLVIDAANKYAVVVYSALQTNKAMNNGGTTNFTIPSFANTGINGTNSDVNGTTITVASSATGTNCFQGICDESVSLVLGFTATQEGVCKAAAATLGTSDECDGETNITYSFRQS